MNLSNAKVEQRCEEMQAVGILDRLVSQDGNLWQPKTTFRDAFEKNLKTLIHPENETVEGRWQAALLLAFIQHAKKVDTKSAEECMTILWNGWFK